MIAALLSWLVGGGATKILDRLAAAHAAKLAAQNDAERIAAEVQIAGIEAEMDAQRQIAATRAATSGQWEMRLLVLVAGLPPAAHFGAVCLDSALPGLFPGWVVHALPAPMADWQGSIILGLFGLSAAKMVAAAVRR